MVGGRCKHFHLLPVDSLRHPLEVLLPRSPPLVRVVWLLWVSVLRGSQLAASLGHGISAQHGVVIIYLVGWGGTITPFQLPSSYPSQQIVASSRGDAASTATALLGPTNSNPFPNKV